MICIYLRGRSHLEKNLSIYQGGNPLHRGFGDPEEHRPSSWFWKKVSRQDGVQKAHQVIKEDKLVCKK